MSSFTNEIKIKLLKDNTYEILEDFHFYTDENNKKIIVPKGYVTDGTSIPRFLWSIAHPLSMPYIKASILHDYMYDMGYDRLYADDIFFYSLNVLKVAKRFSLLMYIGVRIFGAKNYKKF